MSAFRFSTLASRKSTHQSPFSDNGGFPQWFIISAITNKDAGNQRKSFSLVETGDIREYPKEDGKFSETRFISLPQIDDEVARVTKKEDKMDKLWENFNEDLISYSCNKGNAIREKTKRAVETKWQRKHKIVLEHRIQEMEVVGRKIANQKKQSLLGIFKSLKVFLAQSFHRTNRKILKGKDLYPKQ